MTLPTICRTPSRGRAFVALSLWLLTSACAKEPVSGGPAVEARQQALGGPLDPPSGLTASLVARDDVRLRWTDNSSAEGSFRVFRSLDQVNWAVVCTTGPSQGACDDQTSMASGQTYRYIVRAFDAAGTT